VAAAAEAEAAAQLQLAAGVAVMKRGRNGKLYSRMVRCHLASNALEWATLGKFKRMSVKGAHVEFAPGASAFVVKVGWCKLNPVWSSVESASLGTQIRGDCIQLSLLMSACTSISRVPSVITPWR